MTTEIRRDFHFVVLQTGRAMLAGGADRAYEAGWGEGGVVQTETGAGDARDKRKPPPSETGAGDARDRPKPPRSKTGAGDARDRPKPPPKRDGRGRRS